jgi:stage IV sporulation protein FB
MMRPTRFDLNFRIGSIPVRISPWFWLIALLLSGLRELIYVPLWVGVVLLSVLVHELGHVLAFKRFGTDASILLYGGGGLAIPEAVNFGGMRIGVAMSTAQSVFVCFAGPFAGFLLGGLALALQALLPNSLRSIGALNFVLASLVWVNIAWGLINLLPVYPLDGGQIARLVWGEIDPVRGMRRSLWLSVIAGGVCAAAGLLLLRSPYIALMFGMLAYQSYMAMRGYE